jgi:hypothetical protein
VESGRKLPARQQSTAQHPLFQHWAFPVCGFPVPVRLDACGLMFLVGAAGQHRPKNRESGSWSAPQEPPWKPGMPEPVPRTRRPDPPEDGYVHRILMTGRHPAFRNHRGTTASAHPGRCHRALRAGRVGEKGTGALRPLESRPDRGPTAIACGISALTGDSFGATGTPGFYRKHPHAWQSPGAPSDFVRAVLAATCRSHCGGEEAAETHAGFRHILQGKPYTPTGCFEVQSHDRREGGRAR